jgi:hypothetical protein
MPVSRTLVLLALCAAAQASFGQTGLVWRTGYLECGTTQIRARAQCYAGSDLCVSETLSFARAQGRAIVGLHAHRAAQAHAGGRVEALDYSASAWTCAAGKTGGGYLIVLMRRSARQECADCEYARLYDLNGRLITAELKFDENGAARGNEKGRALMQSLLSDLAARAYRPVYRPY